MHVVASGEVLLEQLARGALVLVVVVHPTEIVVEPLDHRAVLAQHAHELVREAVTGELGVEAELGVVEAHAVELDDASGDLLPPVLAAGLLHPEREPVQRDVEDVAALALEPGGEAAVVVVLLDDADAAAGAREDVGGGEAAEARADDDDVVAVPGALQGVALEGALAVAVAGVELLVTAGDGRLAEGRGVGHGVLVRRPPHGGCERVLVGHGDPREHRADDAEVALVGAAEEEAVDGRAAVRCFGGCRTPRRRGVR